MEQEPFVKLTSTLQSVFVHQVFKAIPWWLALRPDVAQTTNVQLTKSVTTLLVQVTLAKSVHPFAILEIVQSELIVLLKITEKHVDADLLLPETVLCHV